MGKASSAKKIARAARAGATSGPNERRQLGFPVIVAAVIIGGLLLVGFARATRDAQASPTLQDHWHQAYTVYDCVQDTFLPPFDSQFDPQGIHSHQDSLIHVHPFTSEVTGKGAKLGRFLETMGATVEPEAITLPGGEALEAGADCGGSPSIIVVAEWAQGLEPGDTPDVVYTENFDDIVFDTNNMAFTIARIAEGATIEPPADAILDALAATQGQTRDDAIDPPNNSARPGPQDFGTGSGPDTGSDTASTADSSAETSTASQGSGESADSSTDQNADSGEATDG